MSAFNVPCDMMLFLIVFHLLQNHNKCFLNSNKMHLSKLIRNGDEIQL